MTERAKNIAGEEPSGGRGRWFESTHSEGVASDAATPAATQWHGAELDEADWQWADEQAALLGLTTEPFPECEHYEFPPGENSQDFLVMWMA